MERLGESRHVFSGQDMSAGAHPSFKVQIDDPLFLEEVRRQMIHFAMQQLGDRSSAEDAVQDALVGALRNRGSFEGRAALKSWMFAILKNKIVDSIRRKSRVSAVEHQVSWDDLEGAGPFDSRGHWHPESRPRPWVQPDESLMDADFWRVFGACLDHLPARQSRVFMKREVLGLETDEICRSLELTVANVHVLLHRARLALRGCLQENWFSEEAR